MMQVGVGHNFGLHATGCKWKLSTSLGGDGVSRIRSKTSVGLVPGVDLRFGWRAEYVLPEVHGLVFWQCLSMEFHPLRILIFVDHIAFNSLFLLKILDGWFLGYKSVDSASPYCFACVLLQCHD